jgi:ORF6N domain-containing protein
MVPGRIESKIHFLRGTRVMLDADLARFYGVTTSSLNQAVRRHGGRRYSPYAFTEHGVAMLSSVLRSDRAVQVNIAIMRAFL